MLDVVWVQSAQLHASLGCAKPLATGILYMVVEYATNDSDVYIRFRVMKVAYFLTVFMKWHHEKTVKNLLP